jgi:DNA-binding HxlR family transcriptional regulator
MFAQRKKAPKTIVSTLWKHGHRKDTAMDHRVSLEPGQKRAAKRGPSKIPVYAPEVDRLSEELIGYIADKWTLLIFEELGEHGIMRFNELRKAVPGISQKMLTQTLRRMERIGLVSRKVHPVIPPHVDYELTELGMSLGPAICHVWNWVERNADAMRQAQHAFDAAAR